MRLKVGTNYEAFKNTGRLIFKQYLGKVRNKVEKYPLHALQNSPLS